MANGRVSPDSDSDGRKVELGIERLLVRASLPAELLCILEQVTL